ncbi:unnamed protein product [Dicrocoelium dendriticum]|nr:unnamed protein product [Dicrocoelium dendriticum]
MSMYIRNPLIRTLHAKFEHQKLNSNSDHPEWYSVCTDCLTSELLTKLQKSEQDEETSAFLSNCFEKSDWFFTHFYHAIAKAVLTWFMTSTSINGLLRRGSMFVYSSRQFASLLDLTDGTKLEMLLDLGAGDGMVTAKMAPFFECVYVTELSRPMQWLLQERNFNIIDIDAWYPTAESDISCSLRYDVVSCLNVLDRCDKPLTMLRQIKSVLRPGTGRLVLGIVLPLKQYVEATSDHRPSEVLDVPTSAQWETQLSDFILNVLRPLHFDLLRWTRLPYLCEGDFSQSFYYLNEVVLVLRVCPENATSADLFV